MRSAEVVQEIGQKKGEWVDNFDWLELECGKGEGGSGMCGGGGDEDPEEKVRHVE
jgi:hypothetical protein